ncbi:efflux RND transporter periplasmic adaptor subunit [Chitinophaga horti]|uniref:Efflux RND transporter periplasmic adaptor subunit n=1 Tax=Chitinophaga horti TaxID=2920382 RepID=A0ABY6J334_9BACT|nr:efflux RND transporter periplasmic adaptor subunit [Chitinophaga horti]UYQ94065.1 efflux RND transporter periplasmic adaptor subunit [Chitinophaga horti]
MRRKFMLPAAILITATVAWVGCGSSESKANKAEVTTEPVKETITLEKGSISTSLNLPGELIAFQQVDLYAKVSSFVKKLNVDVGSEVKAGQLLAVLEAPEISAQLSGADSRLQALQALYTASKANYDRLLETSKTPGTISPNDLDIAKARQQADYAQLQAAKAAQKEISDNRNYLEIRAPFNGVITSRNVSAGAFVGPNAKEPMLTLQEQDHLRLVVAVPEVYSVFINKNSKIDFSVKSLPGQKFSANVSRLAGALDNRLRSQRIEMDVPNTNKKLLPGMVAELQVSLPATDSAYVVPSSAVLTSSEGVFVIKVNNKKVEWVPIKKGREADKKVEIFGDLQASDTIVKEATEEVRNGSVWK